MASITTWSRIEPRTRAGTLPAGANGKAPDPLQLSLQARFRDPAWALGRQWQVGEFLADDAGSPVHATIRAEHVGLSSYRPGLSGPAAELDGTVPLEAQVEREPADLGLWGSLRLGLHFEALLGAAGLGAHVGAFRSAYAIPAAPPATEVRSTEGDRLRVLAAGRATDGLSLLVAASQAGADYTTVPPIPTLNPPTGSTRTPAEEREAVAKVVEALMEYREAVYGEAAGGAWVPNRLEFEFALGSESSAGDIELEAPEYGGGRIDWHVFSIGDQPLSSPGSATVSTEECTFVPNNVSFRGMPNSRWWSFEDGQTDFGKLDTERVDLAKLIVMEFALVHGDDWFELPVSAPVGSLSRIKLLLVTDTFGNRTVIRPTDAQVPPGERPWSLFQLSGQTAATDFLLLPPSAGSVEDGPELEEALFMRDEVAAMSWAVERRLQGAFGQAVDGYELYRQRLAAHPPPEPAYRTPGGPDIRYVLGRSVPDNWIPLVPVRTGERGLLFRRGLMQSPVWTGPAPDDYALEDIRARGRVLEPWHPFYVNDEAIPRAGVRVRRMFRRARTSDGSTVLWAARRARAGRGEGSSGLEWDAVEPIPEEPQA